jgi:hypothetical protein
MFGFKKVKYKSKGRWILGISKMKWIVQLQKYVIFLLFLGKGREDRIKYDTFRENSGVQGLLTGLKQE